MQPGRTYHLKLSGEKQHLKVREWALAVGIKVLLAKLDDHRSQISQSVTLMRSVSACRSRYQARLADETQLEPKPVFHRRSDGRQGFSVELYTANDFVQCVLEGIAFLSRVTDLSVVLKEEGITLSFRQTTISDIASSLTVYLASQAMT